LFAVVVLVQLVHRLVDRLRDARLEGGLLDRRLLHARAATAGRAGRAAPAARLRLRLGAAATFQLRLVEAGEHDRDVARALADARSATPRARTPALNRRALVGEGP